MSADDNYKRLNAGTINGNSHGSPQELQKKQCSLLQATVATTTTRMSKTHTHTHTHKERERGTATTCGRRQSCRWRRNGWRDRRDRWRPTRTRRASATPTDSWATRSSPRSVLRSASPAGRSPSTPTEPTERKWISDRNGFLLLPSCATMFHWKDHWRDLELYWVLLGFVVFFLLQVTLRGPIEEKIWLDFKWPRITEFLPGFLKKWVKLVLLVTELCHHVPLKRPIEEGLPKMEWYLLGFTGFGHFFLWKTSSGYSKDP